MTSSARTEQQRNALVDFLSYDATRDSGKLPRLVGPVSVRPTSVIYYAETSCFPTPVAVKFCRSSSTGAPDVAAAREQFRSLQEVGSKLQSDTRHAVPRAYKIDAERGLVAIEW